jgi:hypothetical protein
MRATFRPSDVYGPPGAPEAPRRPVEADDDGGPARRRWPLLAGLAVLVLLVAAVLAGPREVGEGGVAPALVDIVSEDQAIAALALHRSQAEAQAGLAVPRSLYTPPGISPVRRAAESSVTDVRARLVQARGVPDADPAVRAYWGAGEHDAYVDRLDVLRRAIDDIGLLAATHDSIYDGAGAIPLGEAQLALASRYLTGTDEQGPMTDWGLALLAELDGVESRAAAEDGRARTDAWWQERTAALEPAALDPLRSYLGGLPPATLRGLEGHPLAGPGLADLRAR